MLAVALLAALPAASWAHPPVAPPVAPPAPPAAPETVPQEIADFRGMLRRLRIDLLHAGRGTQHFGDLGDGEQLWFVLPSCRTASAEDERRDPCPIDRLEVTAEGVGAVRMGRMTTVLDGDTPRRVQAVVIAPGTRTVRVRMVTPRGSTRFDGVIRVSDVGELPVPVGAPTATGFALDFREYPGR
ncbi:MAG: hypothetical protein U0325_23375 [Polyangiales bacterium]